MWEVDVLAVGEKSHSGDAIAMRFTRPDTGTLAHVVIDAGFQSSGEAVVEFVKSRYGTEQIDYAFLTHPDRDHIGGMGAVLRGLDVGTLVLQRLSLHGGSSLPAADAVEELCAIADENGTGIYDVDQGNYAFGGAVFVAGPSRSWYESLVSEQIQEQTRESASHPETSGMAEAVRKMLARVLTSFPVETNFDDAGGTNARNNSSLILDVRIDNYRLMFMGDAGVPAINAALDYLEAIGRADVWPRLVVVPHHGSRHNLDRATIERLVGPNGDGYRGDAFVSIAKAAAEDPRYPSPRITNAFGRRGYYLGETAGINIWAHSPDAPGRADYSALARIPPKDEAIDDR